MPVCFSITQYNEMCQLKGQQIKRLHYLQTSWLGYRLQHKDIVITFVQVLGLSLNPFKETQENCTNKEIHQITSSSLILSFLVFLTFQNLSQSTLGIVKSPEEK